jgi:hypothetical protein
MPADLLFQVDGVVAPGIIESRHCAELQARGREREQNIVITQELQFQRGRIVVHPKVTLRRLLDSP